MTPTSVVKLAEGGDGAPTLRFVRAVNVHLRSRLGAHVESNRRIDGVVKVPLDASAR